MSYRVIYSMNDLVHCKQPHCTLKSTQADYHYNAVTPLGQLHVIMLSYIISMYRLA